MGRCACGWGSLGLTASAVRVRAGAQGRVQRRAVDRCACAVAKLSPGAVYGVQTAAQALPQPFTVRATQRSRVLVLPTESQRVGMRSLGPSHATEASPEASRALPVHVDDELRVIYSNDGTVYCLLGAWERKFRLVASYFSAEHFIERPEGGEALQDSTSAQASPVARRALETSHLRRLMRTAALVTPVRPKLHARRRMERMVGLYAPESAQEERAGAYSAADGTALDVPSPDALMDLQRTSAELKRCVAAARQTAAAAAVQR